MVNFLRIVIWNLKKLEENNYDNSKIESRKLKNYF